jgi:hypothetical protein
LPTIDVDFKVYGMLARRRESEGESYSDILLRVLEPSLPGPGDEMTDGCVLRGVFFPNGTLLRATHLGRTHFAEIKGGAMVLDGEPQRSLSAAGKKITNGKFVNAWYFWQVKRPSDPEWQCAMWHRNLQRRRIGGHY